MLASRVRFVAVVTFAAVACLTFAGCDQSKVSSDNLAKVSTGMTVDQVKAILGPGTQEMSTGTSIDSSGLGGTRTDTHTTVYRWEDGRKTITVTFRDGKVLDKVGEGL